jgi:predicted nucleotidyltransferase component of viral defense system
MKWHEQAVTDDTKNAAAILAGVLAGDFYLAGGTALALRIGHRISLDLDLFTKNPLNQRARIEIKSRLAEHKGFRVLAEEEGTLHFILEKTSISLLHFPYPIIGHLKNKWQGLPIATLEDIAAMKLNAVLGRGSKKDFVDLYFLIERIGLKRIFKSGEEKFPDSPLFLLQAAKAMVFFDDAEQEPMPKMIASVDWLHLKECFEKRIPPFVKANLS